ncbi:MAG: M15 family metallopeptidase [Frankiaceae bacterium]|nr:M15 family metallopeptidase [Frankiaceae bacterium]
MPSPHVRRTRPVLALLAATLLGALAGCGGGDGKSSSPALHTAVSDPAQPTDGATAAQPLNRPGIPVTVAPLSTRLRPDVLVTGTRTFSPGAVRRLTALSPAHGVVVFRAGRVKVAGHVVRTIAVDPSTFRRFTSEGTAETTPVWLAVARGEAVASHSLATGLKLGLGGNATVARLHGGKATTLRVGAFATTAIPGTDLIVDDELGRALGLPAATGMLLTAGKDVDPVALAGKVRAITGDGGSVDLLTPPAANPVAFLTGSRAAKAFGAFSYRYFPDGTIQPDSRWVGENIVTATVPILGRVTCHRLLVPQLRGALADVQAAGLASSLHSYDGCYVPRFIESNPEHAISLHTWGIAIDLDASTNYRGIEGTMDPKIVDIFKRWGFRWGGDWEYTDPMHFELGALLSSPR